MNKIRRLMKKTGKKQEKTVKKKNQEKTGNSGENRKIRSNSNKTMKKLE